MDVLLSLDALPGFDQSPGFLSGYLRYMALNKNRTPSSLENIYLSLRDFLQYLIYKEKAQCAPPSAASFRDMNASLISCQKVAAVTTEEIEEYLYFLDATVKNSPSTINKKITYLRQFYTYLFTQQADLQISMPSNPAATLSDLSTPPSTLNLLSKDEIKALLQSVRGVNTVRDTAIIQLILTTGITLSEIAGLDYPKDLENGRLFIRGSNARTVLLPRDTRDVLSDYLAEYRSPIASQLHDDALFVSLRDYKRLGQRGIQVMIAKHVAAAGLAHKGFSPQDLRDTAICTVLRKAAPSDRRFILEYYGIRQKKSAARYDSIKSIGRNSIVAGLAVQVATNFTN